LGRPERGQSFDDAGVVGDHHLPVLLLQRHVIIHAHEYALAAHIQISNRQLRHSVIPHPVFTIGIPPPGQTGRRIASPKTGAGSITDPGAESKRFPAAR
jgi:hypothetical protein